MKFIIYLSVLVILFSTISCNDDFLKTGNTDSFNLEDTLRITNKTQGEQITLQINGLQNQDYQVVIMPMWMKIEEMEGRFSNGQTTLTVSVSENELYTNWGFYNGRLALQISSIGQISIPVVYGNFGNPEMVIDKNEIAIGTASSASFTIRNPGNSGILYWYIPELPDWLLSNPGWGIIQPGESQTVTISAMRINQDVGVYNFDLLIGNNSAGIKIIPISMQVKDFMGPDVLTALAGDVVDAEFCKSTGVLALVTREPNQLYLFDTQNRTLKSLSLASVPSCISIEEEGTKVAIGTTNSQVIEINAASVSVIRSHSVDCIPYDIVLAGSSWVYITPVEGQWVHSRSLNLTTGKIVKSSNSNAIYEKTAIRKIPGKPNLLGTRTNLSPTGILLFDISTGACNDNINYWHESITNFWPSEDGKRMFCATGKVYHIPEYVNEYIHSIDILPVGDLTFDWKQTIDWIEHSSGANKIFVVRSNTSYSGDSENAWIDVYNAHTYSKLETIIPWPFVVSIGGVKNYYETIPRFVFASGDGKSMYVVKNIKADYKIGNAWSIETIALLSVN